VQITYAVEHDLTKEVGRLTRGDVAMGKAVQHLTGTYDAHGNTTSINMKLEGQGMPVDDLEQMLPALGVTLPSGSRLKGGTLAVDFAIIGPVDKLVTTGTLKLENASLSGFNLSSKLSAISALSGKSGGGGNDMVIQNFSSEVRVAPEGTNASNIDLVVPSLGNVTGAGTVSPSNALDFKLKATLGGAGIPFFVQGTTSDPKFTPDVKGMANGLLQGALGDKSGQKNALGGVGGCSRRSPDPLPTIKINPYLSFSCSFPKTRSLPIFRLCDLL
jgi:AsmA protein